MADPETAETALSPAEVELEALLADKEPVMLKPHFRIEDKRKLVDGRTVEITIQELEGKPRRRYLHVIYPPDGLGRYDSEGYLLTDREFKKYKNPAHRDWKPLEVLEDRDMTDEDDVRAIELLEEFKAAPPKGEVIDDKGEK